MAVLYRKYRPQNFSEVVGQKYSLQTLKNQVEQGQISHAYLFTGSRGVGKTSVARIMAKAINCLTPKKGEPCGKCAICQQFSSNTFLDLVEIDAASNTGVDNVRDLIEHVKFSPSAGKYKVFIIDEVHMLSKGAFNALLKTLEEPPKHAVFILATTEIHKVPATIISRTQKFDFKRLGSEELKEHLQNILKTEKIKLPESVVSLIVQNADGSGRDALSLLEKVLSLGADVTLEESEQLLGVTDAGVSVELLSAIAGKNSSSLPPFFDRLLETGLDFSIFNKDFLEFLRKLLIFKITEGQVAVSIPEEHKAKAENLAQGFSAQDLMFFIRLFLRSYKEMSSSPSPQIPLLLASLEAQQKLSPQKETPVRAAPAQPVVSSVTQKPAPADKPEPKNEEARKQEPQEAETESPAPAGEIGMEEVKKDWARVVDKVKALNGPLANLLKTSPVIRTSGSFVVLGAKFLFHKQNIENPKNQKILKQALKEVFGINLGCSAEVQKEAKQEKAPTAEILTDALKIFGGELVE